MQPKPRKLLPHLLIIAFFVFAILKPAITSLPADTLKLVKEDDKLSDKKPQFHEELTDARGLNKSAAVIKLDTVTNKKAEEWLSELRPTFREAIRQAAAKGAKPLPSIELAKAKAKYFDDRLYGAIDVAMLEKPLVGDESLPQLLLRIGEKLPVNSSARAYLAAGLSLAGVNLDCDRARKERFLSHFNGSVLGGVISFYEKTPRLTQAFKLLRFFQMEFKREEFVDELACVLAADPALADHLRKVNYLYCKLTNPLHVLAVSDLVEGSGITEKSLEKLAALRNLPHRPIGRTIALLPPSRSHETELFEKVFPRAAPREGKLMQTLVQHISDGKLDLKPKPDSGWYDHQCYALETLLVPNRGPERDKLLMTGSYKARLVQAFEATLIATRETHARQVAVPFTCSAPAPPPERPSPGPELRIEPAPTFYLRTARSYAFLKAALLEAVGHEMLSALDDPSTDNAAPVDWITRMDEMHRLFIGLHLLTNRDIGLKPDLADDEKPLAEGALAAAETWLAGIENDPCLDEDVRVAVPIMFDQGVTVLWVTLGVELVPLETSYAKGPSVRWQGQWTEMIAKPRDASYYLLPVVSSAEVQTKGGVLSRSELRNLCDKMKTKEKILNSIRLLRATRR